MNGLQSISKLHQLIFIVYLKFKTLKINKRLKNDVSFIKNLINSNDDGLSENIRTFKK
jgi:hypothetical protein